MTQEMNLDGVLAKYYQAIGINERMENLDHDGEVICPGNGISHHDHHEKTR